MLDLIIRNARRAHASGGPKLVDIGFRDGRIAAIEPHITAEDQSTTPRAACAAPG